MFLGPTDGCGASSGGICSFTVAWERPDQFRKVLSTIGSFVDLPGILAITNAAIAAVIVASVVPSSQQSQGVERETAMARPAIAALALAVFATALIVQFRVEQHGMENAEREWEASHGQLS